MDRRGAGTDLRRERLEAALDRALTHRLTIVTADAGFGKTTLLNSWSRGINAVVLTTDDRTDLPGLTRTIMDALQLRVPNLSRELAGAVGGVLGPGEAATERVRPEAIAEQLGQTLERLLVRDLVLVLDNAHHVFEDRASSRMLAGLIRHAPPLLHMILAMQGAPTLPIDRLRDQGQVLEIHGTDLAFTADEIRALLGTATGDLAEKILGATSGWPVAVRLVVESIRAEGSESRADRSDDLAGPEGQLHELMGRIFDEEPEPNKRLLQVVTLFDQFTVELCAALGLDNAPAIVDELDRRGLFLEPVPDQAGGYRLHAVARDFVARHAPLPRDQANELHIAAARWFVATGSYHAGLRSLISAGHTEELVALLAEKGEQLATSGHAGTVVSAVETLDEDSRDGTIERVAGVACQVQGDWTRALQHFARAAAGLDQLDAGLAWRMGLIQHLRGDLEAALLTYGRGRLDGEPTPDKALLLAWTAAVHWLQSDSQSCGDLAVRALGIATTANDPQALAAAHTVLALLAALEGDRRANDAHYLKALEYAETAGDTLQLIRIHTNRASHHAEEGAYLESLDELDIAIRLADVSGFAVFAGLALTNRADTLISLGRLEEAHTDLRAAVAIFHELESRLVAYPLRKLGDLHYLRGEATTARQAFEQAIEAASEGGDVQALVPALAGLAQLVADEDPEHAAELARQARESGEGMGYVTALIASARVALASGDVAEARRSARSARRTAEERLDRAGLAEALEVESQATSDARAAVALAESAIELWREIEAPIGQARAELIRAEHLDEAAEHAVVEAVRDRMSAVGCRLLTARAAGVLSRLSNSSVTAIRLETLGGFRVVRDGVAIPHSEWGSRKARDLLKLLITRRGRPILREQLMEILWPGQEPGAVANSFNVALSTLRSVLDPERTGLGSTLVVTADEALRLETHGVEIDVESFLEGAASGLRLLQDGRESEAAERLAQAEAMYTGDFLEEDLYEDWAAVLREEARATYVQITSRLAELARRRGDADAAVRYLLRILERDPYDERAHLELVSTLTEQGRHGAARRHYRTYSLRMEELGVEAAPFPGSPRGA